MPIFKLRKTTTGIYNLEASRVAMKMLLVNICPSTSAAELAFKNLNTIINEAEEDAKLVKDGRDQLFEEHPFLAQVGQDIINGAAERLTERYFGVEEDESPVEDNSREVYPIEFFYVSAPIPGKEADGNVLWQVDQYGNAYFAGLKNHVAALDVEWEIPNLNHRKLGKAYYVKTNFIKDGELKLTSS
jgi:hypothetical protein